MKEWKYKSDANTKVGGRCPFFKCPYYDKVQGCTLNRYFKTCEHYPKSQKFKRG